MKNNDRRNFLKKSSALGSAFLFSPMLHFSQSGVNNSLQTIIANNKKRILGKGTSSIEVSALGLGCMGMSYHRSFIPDKKEMIKLIRKAPDLGLVFLILRKLMVR